MVMVVVITCLLSHYKLSARSFIGRHSQGRRREDALSSVSALPSRPPPWQGPLLVEAPMVPQVGCPSWRNETGPRRQPAAPGGGGAGRGGGRFRCRQRHSGDPDKKEAAVP